MWVYTYFHYFTYVFTSWQQFVQAVQINLLFFIKNFAIMSSCPASFFLFEVSLSLTPILSECFIIAELWDKTDHKGFEWELNRAAIHINKSGSPSDEGGSILMPSIEAIYTKQS